MATINENFLKLQGSYLFPEIGRRIRSFEDRRQRTEDRRQRTEDREGGKIISLGIGDVTQPLAPAIVEAMKKAVVNMGSEAAFRGYGPEQGYDFLIDAIIQNDFNPARQNLAGGSRSIDLDSSEIFVSDGAKCDTGNIQEIFGLNNVIAVTDPVYPVYVDTNVMAGRTGQADKNGQYSKIVYMPCTAENNFIPEPPPDDGRRTTEDGRRKTGAGVDIIYLCFPNNPTGAVATKEILNRWVNFARNNKAIILFDAAYEAFITDPDIPHSIYEVEGAKEVAIEFRSFSKTAGFTGVRCAFTVVPKQLKAYTEDGRAVEVNPIWHRRQCTKFNGASYISQAGAAAVYTTEGKKQCRQIIDIYMTNAAVIRTSLTKLGYDVYGGVNAPYVWMKTPDGLSSWDFFDHLLQKANVVGTPGSGFGPAGEGYLRLSAFAKPDDVKEAMQRFAAV